MALHLIEHFGTEGAVKSVVESLFCPWVSPLDCIQAPDMQTVDRSGKIIIEVRFGVITLIHFPTLETE